MGSSMPGLFHQALLMLVLNTSVPALVEVFLDNSVSSLGLQNAGLRASCYL